MNRSAPDVALVLQAFSVFMGLFCERSQIMHFTSPGLTYAFAHVSQGLFVFEEPCFGGWYCDGRVQYDLAGGVRIDIECAADRLVQGTGERNAFFGIRFHVVADGMGIGIFDDCAHDVMNVCGREEV